MARTSASGIGGVARVSQEIGLRARNAGQRLTSRAARVADRPAAPTAQPTQPAPAAPEEPVVDQVAEPAAAPRAPRANPFTGLAARARTASETSYRFLASAVASIRPLAARASRTVQPAAKTLVDRSGAAGIAVVRTGRRLLSNAASTSAWANTARLIARVTLEIGKRIDVGILAYAISLPLLAVMFLLILLEAAGVGTVELIPAIIIAIGAAAVYVFTRVRRARSGNIRRAERAADALDEDRA